MTGSVLVAGDANVDLVLRGDVVPRFGQTEQLLTDASLVLGSSGGIVAAGLARLGVPVAVAALTGGDELGAIVRDRLAERGVDVSALRAVPGEKTGLSVVLSGGGDRAILTHAGAMAALGADDVRAAVTRLRPAHVHVAAVFLLPRLLAELPGLLTWIRERGATTSLDTNWDPREHWEGVAECLPHLDALLPNRAELRALAAAAGIDAGGSDDDLTRALARRGPRVVVKAGAEGAVAALPDGTVHRAAPPEADVVDTTGAGDSFDAGYLAALLRGESEPERLRWACAAGALSTRASGGTAAQPTAAELARALA